MHFFVCTLEDFPNENRSFEYFPTKHILPQISQYLAHNFWFHRFLHSLSHIFRLYFGKWRLIKFFTIFCVHVRNFSSNVFFLKKDCKINDLTFLNIDFVFGLVFGLLLPYLLTFIYIYSACESVKFSMEKKLWLVMTRQKPFCDSADVSESHYWKVCGGLCTVYIPHIPAYLAYFLRILQFSPFFPIFFRTYFQVLSLQMGT